MSMLTAAKHPAVGGGPSASDSGDCGIEEEAGQLGISMTIKRF